MTAHTTQWSCRDLKNLEDKCHVGLWQMWRGCLYVIAFYTSIDQDKYISSFILNICTYCLFREGLEYTVMIGREDFPAFRHISPRASVINCRESLPLCKPTP